MNSMEKTSKSFGSSIFNFFKTTTDKKPNKDKVSFVETTEKTNLFKPLFDSFDENSGKLIQAKQLIGEKENEIENLKKRINLASEEAHNHFTKLQTTPPPSQKEASLTKEHLTHLKDCEIFHSLNLEHLRKLKAEKAIIEKELGQSDALENIFKTTIKTLEESSKQARQDFELFAGNINKQDRKLNRRFAVCGFTLGCKKIYYSTNQKEVQKKLNTAELNFNNYEVKLKEQEEAAKLLRQQEEAAELLRQQEEAAELKRQQEEAELKRQQEAAVAELNCEESLSEDDQSVNSLASESNGDGGVYTRTRSKTTKERVHDLEFDVEDLENDLANLEKRVTALEEKVV